MELKWTSKALPDLARLYEFLAPVNQPAAAHTVQALATAPASLRVNFRCRVRLRTDCRMVRKRTLHQLQFPVACHGDQHEEATMIAKPLLTASLFALAAAAFA